MTQSQSENSEPDQFLGDYIASVTGATAVFSGEAVQSLWSGFGQIRRFQITGATGIPAAAETGAKPTTIIVKDVNPPSESKHPRGWNTSLSNQRKLRSYEVELAWYAEYAPQLDQRCRVATCYGATVSGARSVLVLEDLDLAFPVRLTSSEAPAIKACLEWLANLHAKFLNVEPDGLWPTGTYWHLDTRPDELAVMEDGKLRQSAEWLDRQLRDCRFQTLVHGDAKVANFCFDEAGARVAAVDFQYAGRGVGIRDVAYFLGSCLDERQLMKEEQQWLECYRLSLVNAINGYHDSMPAEEIANAWIDLYAVAWTDFYRFLAGWMPDHPKVHAYTLKLAKRVLEESAR